MELLRSRNNPLFRQLKKLATSSRERRKVGQTLLDGPHLLAACLDVGQMPQRLVVSESGMRDEEITALLQRAESVPRVIVADALLREISPVETPVGLLTVIEIPRRQAAANADFCLLLEGIQDPGNLGALLRSAAAAGVQAVWLSAGCCDAWAPKVLRGGMGAHFVVDIEENVDLLQRVASFHGLTVATSLDAPRSLYTLDLRGPVAFMIGNEGAGLSPALQAAASAQVHIPMPGRVESLNAAAAATICLFERVRQCHMDTPH
ncbi:MAG: RNA methyltransferase [Methylophilaceae bacterium]|nr:RNA methyltransferase [Methylophilaceae bacterium]